jgi:cytidine deaminase
MCAERNTVFKAMLDGYKKEDMVAMALCADADEVPYPCGACRQVLLEYEKRQNTPIRIIVYAKEEAYIIESAKSLLPFSFNM